MATPKPVPIDSVQVEASFANGIVRDTPRHLIAEGGIYDSVNFMLEQPGRVYKRGGWLYHSAALPSPPSMVGTIHIPTRVVAIASSGGVDHLYDVTSEISPIAVESGTVGFSPRENPTYHVGKLIVCDGNVANRPKKVFTSGPTGVVTLGDLGGNPPYAAHSAVNAGRIVLARGSTSAGFDYSNAPNKNRIWFSELPNVEDPWDVNTKYFDTTYEITGLAVIQGVLLVFSPHFCERLIGGIPPGVSAGPTEAGVPENVSGNMELQAVGGVGCQDARSIVTLDNQILFGSEEGFFTTNGVGFTNLMENETRSGILSYWRSLFAEHEVRGVVAGMLNRDYLFVSAHSTDGSDADFICYLPTRTWMRTANTRANMFATGATEQETTEMYAAMGATPYVAKFSPMLRPSWANRADGDVNGLAVEPSLETRMFGSGPGLKAFGFGRLTWDMDVPDSVRGMHRLPSTPYAIGVTAFQENRIYRVTVAGTTAPTAVNWLAAPNVGDTLTDGGVTWTNIGPELQLSQATGIEAESYTPVYESPLHVVSKADRTRFRLFKDTQALFLRFRQKGASEQTELFLVEVEHRSYSLPADGE